MKVSELIELLKAQPQHLTVVYSKYSEYCMLEANDIGVGDLGHPRDDGWVPRPRPDKEKQTYLIFPGN